MYKYMVGHEVIEKLMGDLKAQCFIDEHTKFNYEKENNPSQEIYYNDYSFLDALGRYRADEILQEILLMLKEHKVIPSDSDYSKTLFEMYHQTLRSKFIVPWKSFSPLMDRLLHLLTSIKRPAKCLAVGINCGYTLGCLGGAFWKNSSDQPPSEIHAIELSRSNMKIAKKNMSTIDLNAVIHYEVGDAFQIIDNYEDESFDYIFLDTRRNYNILLKIYDKLKKGGWLLMHNASDRHFVKEMKPYLEFVRNKEFFAESILFHIDTNGLELSVKNS